MSYEEFWTPTSIVDGWYRGIRGGYVLEFEYDGKKVRIATSLGVRGTNIPCVFNVSDGKLIEESIRNE